MLSTANLYSEELKDNSSYMNDGRLKKVFIVEDNEMHSMMMDYLLSKENNLHIFRFKSGEDCIKKLNLRPDIVILDYGLPGINGLETFAHIKAHNPDIPVIVVSENTNDSIVKQFKEKGVFEYIVKESDSFHKLNRVVESVLLKLAEKEYLHNSRLTVMITCGFILAIILSCIISYFILKH